MTFDKPFSDTGLEKEAQEYSASYKCSIETARRDVWDEYGDIATEVDSFLDRE